LSCGLNISRGSNLSRGSNSLNSASGNPLKCGLPGLPVKFSVSKFNEFEPRLKSAKNRFQLSAGLNFGTLNTVLSGINHI